jgi:hypothetical protein
MTKAKSSHFEAISERELTLEDESEKTSVNDSSPSPHKTILALPATANSGAAAMTEAKEKQLWQRRDGGEWSDSEKKTAILTLRNKP